MPAALFVIPAIVPVPFQIDDTRIGEISQDGGNCSTAGIGNGSRAGICQCCNGASPADIQGAGRTIG